MNRTQFDFLWRPTVGCANVARIERHPAAQGERGSRFMGFMDKIKGLVKGNKSAVKDGVDKAADAVQSKTPDSVDAQVEQGASAVKDVIDKIN